MTDQPALSIGATGEWVTYLHGMLEYKQYGSGFTGDAFDKTTEAAVRYAQQQNSLGETGKCDAATWIALTSEQNSSVSPPGDFGICVADELAAPDVEELLEELDPLPSNAHMAS